MVDNVDEREREREREKKREYCFFVIKYCYIENIKLKYKK